MPRRHESSGAFAASNQVSIAIGFIRTQIGEGIEMFFGWDRTGAATFPLLAKGDWSALALFGKSGRFELSAKGSRQPIDSVGFGYRVIGDDIVIDLDPVTLQGFAAKVSPNAVMAIGAEPVGMDPMTILTIFQVLRMVWELLHPTANLCLGGNVEATAVLNGDVLTIQFSQCPSIEIKAFWTFNLAVKQVVLTTDKVHLDFDGSSLIKSREFDLV